MNARLPAALVAALLVAIALPASAQDHARARQIAGGKCFLCHGMSGESSSEVYPRLAAQNAAYVAKQLKDFQSGRRKGTTMNDMVAGLSSEDMDALGRFYAAQSAEPHAPADADLAAMGRYLYQRGNSHSGVAACASCHGPKAAGTELLPRLAGQQAAYLEEQLRLFNKRERNNDNAVMHSIATKLTGLEIRSLAEYLASMP
jgi:cytochrome c553